MASLSSARSTLLDLKVQLARKNQEYLTLVSGNAQANTVAVQAAIANLHAQIATQRASVKSASGFTATTNINPVGASGGPSSSFDAVPQAGSANAMQSGGAFAALAAKQPAIASNAALTARDVTAQGTLTTTGGITANIDAPLGTASQPNVTSVGNLELLNVTGNLVLDSSLLFVNANTSRIGINTTFPQTLFDVYGRVNVTGGYRAGGQGNVVLTGTALGPDIKDSALRTLGTLTQANVAGNIVQTSGTASFAAVSALDVDTMGGAFTGNTIQDRGHTILGNNLAGPHSVFPTAPGITPCAFVGWNHSGGQREMSFVNNDPGTDNRGFILEQRTGANAFTQLARFDGTGVRLLGQYPIQFRRFSPINATNEYVDTTFDVADWHPCVASIRVLNGRIDATASMTSDIFHAYFVNNGSGKWRLKTSFKTLSGNNETCHAVGMFVHRSLSTQDPGASSLII